ncbi:hypothetical protein [Desulfovibrio desulfuricans]|uniref:hypothetical protein n=1 Tax=Desulfovibrio desulfuricans TaxID=876 RepID=UPI0003B65298|nr:hypothetical protein [Desulfovibrio desulfuricans]
MKGSLQLNSILSSIKDFEVSITTKLTHLAKAQGGNQLQRHKRIAFIGIGDIGNAAADAVHDKFPEVQGFLDVIHASQADTPEYIPALSCWVTECRGLYEREPLVSVYIVGMIDSSNRLLDALDAGNAVRYLKCEFVRGFFALHDGWDSAVPALCNADIAVSLTECEGVEPGRGGDLEQDGLFLELYDFLLNMLDDDLLMV